MTDETTRIAELDDARKMLQGLLERVETELHGLLKPTTDEENAVTDLLLDEAHDCPEAVAEELGRRIDELRMLREMREDTADGRRCADCGLLIPEGQELCNCNNSGDIGG